MQRDHGNLVHFARPMLLRPSPQVPPADEAGLVVVGAEVGRARMGNLDRDERDVRFAVLGGDDRRHVLVGLELDHQIDLLAHEDVGVALRDLGAVAVVDRDELDALCGGGALQAVGDFLRELVVGALRRVAQPIGLLAKRPHVRSIQVLADLLDHPAALERVEETEGHALGEPAAGDDFTKRERFPRRTECGQHLGRVHDRLHEVGVARRRLRLHGHYLEHVPRSSLRNVSKHSMTAMRVAKWPNKASIRILPAQAGPVTRFARVLPCGTV